MADSLSRRHSLLVMMEPRVLGFTFIQEFYHDDEDFKPYLNDQDNDKHCPYTLKNVSYSRAISFVFLRDQSKSF